MVYLVSILLVRFLRLLTTNEQDGDTVAVINDFEIYANRKEEIVARVFGVIDPGHPYIEHIYSGGDYLIGGEVQLLDRIRYLQYLVILLITASGKISTSFANFNGRKAVTNRAVCCCESW